MTLTKMFAFQPLTSLFTTDNRTVDRTDESNVAKDYLEKVETAQTMLETELPEHQRNWVRFLDC